jgi:hypothetical protein
MRGSGFPSQVEKWAMIRRCSGDSCGDFVGGDDGSFDGDGVLFVSFESQCLDLPFAVLELVGAVA